MPPCFVAGVRKAELRVVDFAETPVPLGEGEFSGTAS